MQELANEHIRMLAEQRREMDAGRQPFVHYPEGGGRIAVNATTLDRLGLEQGQTIDSTTFGAILKEQSRQCEEALAARRATRH